MDLQTATSPATLDVRDELEYLRLLDLEIETERRKLALAEKENLAPVSVVPSYQKAFIEAFPLHQFIRETFPIIEQGREFQDNWHISVISELLQAAVLREVRDFIINIPRRTMKSTLVCVMFPCWVWTFLPHSRFLFTSYNAEFAGRDSKKCHELINSFYYQQRWGGEFSFTTEKLEKKLGNSKGGYRIVFKIGKGTGEGGDFVIADDPNAIDEVESDTILDKTNNGWNESTYNSVTDRRTSVHGIIQQRTAENDLTGNITETPELKQLYEHLCLAMRFESDNPVANTPDNPLYLGMVSHHEKSSNSKLVIGEEKLWIDPRNVEAPLFPNVWYQEWYKKEFLSLGLESKGDGQLLWETYINDEEIKKEVAHLKAYGESSQYQQRPIRRGGNFFDSRNFEQINLSQIDLDNLILCRGFDKAATEGAGDYTVGLLMARTIKRPFVFYILDIYRKQVSYYERMAKMKEIAKQDTFDYIESRENNEYGILIEKEGGSSGVDVAIIEKDELIGYDVQVFNPRQKKAVRAKPAKTASEAGRIKIVKGLWNVEFIRELERFDPKKERQINDQIDTFAMVFNRLCFWTLNSSEPDSGFI